MTFFALIETSRELVERVQRNVGPIDFLSAVILHSGAFTVPAA